MFSQLVFDPQPRLKLGRCSLDGRSAAFEKQHRTQPLVKLIIASGVVVQVILDLKNRRFPLEGITNLPIGKPVTELFGELYSKPFVECAGTEEFVLVRRRNFHIEVGTDGGHILFLGV